MARLGLAKLGRMYSSRYSAAIVERLERALLSPKASGSCDIPYIFKHPL